MRADLRKHHTWWSPCHSFVPYPATTVCKGDRGEDTWSADGERGVPPADSGREGREPDGLIQRLVGSIPVGRRSLPTPLPALARRPDFIVLATGSIYPFPAKSDQPNTLDAIGRYRDAHAHFTLAHRVMPLGAEPVGWNSPVRSPPCGRTNTSCWSTWPT
jgi:hypothetical protein